MNESTSLEDVSTKQKKHMKRRSRTHIVLQKGVSQESLSSSANLLPPEELPALGTCEGIPIFKHPITEWKQDSNSITLFIKLSDVLDHLYEMKYNNIRY